MADRWFYARGDDRKGPYTAQELRRLADAGEITPADTVWKEGVEKGVAAARVKNLFPPPRTTAPPTMGAPETDAGHAQAPSAALTAAPEPSDAPDADEANEVVASDPTAEPDAAAIAPQEEDVLPETVPSHTPGGGRRPDHVRKARAVSGKGATVVGQDGTYARVRKKCDKCGQEENSVATVRIKSGNNKLFFFCRKCKRRREVTFLGIVT